MNFHELSLPAASDYLLKVGQYFSNCHLGVQSPLSVERLRGYEAAAILRDHSILLRREQEAVGWHFCIVVYADYVSNDELIGAAFNNFVIYIIPRHFFLGNVMYLVRAALAS